MAGLVAVAVDLALKTTGRERRAVLCGFIYFTMAIVCFSLCTYISLFRYQLTQSCNNMTASFQRYNTAGLHHQQSWQDLQSQYRCCGAKSLYDWNRILNLDTPASCCKKPLESCTIFDLHQFPCIVICLNLFDNFTRLFRPNVVFSLILGLMSFCLSVWSFVRSFVRVRSSIGSGAIAIGDAMLTAASPLASQERQSQEAMLNSI